MSHYFIKYIYSKKNKQARRPHSNFMIWKDKNQLHQLPEIGISIWKNKILDILERKKI